MGEDPIIRKILEELVQNQTATRLMLQNVDSRLEKIEERGSKPTPETTASKSAKPKGEAGRSGNNPNKPGFNLFEQLQVTHSRYLEIREYVRKQCHRHDLTDAATYKQNIMKLASIGRLTLEEFNLPEDKEWCIMGIVSTFLQAHRAYKRKKARQAGAADSSNTKKPRCIVKNPETSSKTSMSAVKGTKTATDAVEYEMNGTVDYNLLMKTMSTDESLPADLAQIISKELHTSLPNSQDEMPDFIDFSSSPGRPPKIKTKVSPMKLVPKTIERPETAISIFADVDGLFYLADGSILEVEFDETLNKFYLIEDKEELILDLMPSDLEFHGRETDFNDGTIRDINEFGHWNVGYFIKELTFVKKSVYGDVTVLDEPPIFEENTHSGASSLGSLTPVPAVDDGEGVFPIDKPILMPAVVSVVSVMEVENIFGSEVVKSKPQSKAKAKAKPKPKPRAQPKPKAKPKQAGAKRPKKEKEKSKPVPMD